MPLDRPRSPPPACWRNPTLTNSCLLRSTRLLLLASRWLLPVLPDAHLTLPCQLIHSLPCLPWHLSQPPPCSPAAAVVSVLPCHPVLSLPQACHVALTSTAGLAHPAGSAATGSARSSVHGGHQRQTSRSSTLVSFTQNRHTNTEQTLGLQQRAMVGELWIGCAEAVYDLRVMDTQWGK